MPKLFDDEEQDDDIEFKTNTHYANSYNQWRQKEELNKLKTKYGDVPLNNSDDDESSSSDEDEVGVQLTEEFEKDFFKTLACLKTKDPSIYDQNTKFFNNDDPNSQEKYFKQIQHEKTKRKDPLLLSNYEKKMVLRTGGKFDDDNSDDDDDDSEKEDPRSHSPTYVEEQQKLKESLKKALEDEEENEENWGGMFKKRVKSEEEAKQEEDEYSQWLKGQKNELSDKKVENELEPLKDYWSNPKLDEEEAFLRDYLLNKRYLEKQNDDYIPTYEEIVHDSDEGLSEDEKNIDEQEEFETKYNFRFEEPDEEYIKRYPRTMANSVRKVDDRRKLKRAEIKERKLEDKKRKEEELKQLKALKKKEIEEKINKLREITGNDLLNFQDEDLDGEFDPDEYDKRMQQIFNEDYYAGEEGDQKPEFSELEEELGPWADNNEPHCEDDDFIMDCDYDPTANSDLSKKKKRNRFDKKGKEKIKFDENDPRFEKYTDELYKLDYEDMIGDIPCRFKYREVVPNSFGLSIEEILIAKDRELNRWCSLKKAVQHRPDNVEKYELIAYKKKAQNENLKKKILSSLYEELEEPTEDEMIKLNKERLNLDKTNETATEEEKKVNDKTNNNSEPMKKKRKKSAESNETGNNQTDNTHMKKKREVNETEKDSTVEGEEKVVRKTTGEVSKAKKKKKSKKTSGNLQQTDEKEYGLNEIDKKSENVVEGKLSRRQKKNKKKSLKEKSEKVEMSVSKKQKRKRKQSEQVDGQSPKKKFKKTNEESDKFNLSDSRLKAYGFNPKKFKNKLKYKKPMNK